MCGIVGFIDNRNKEEKTEILDKMMERIHHRGPNSGGKFIGKRAAIGFRRLSIIDLEGGSQPIYNETENLVLTFNGEIYNYKEIRKDLVEKGHIFKTETDTEVILHGYEEYGKGILDKLRGMFAFVIWDIEKRELFGARDLFGIKPFYYANIGGTFMYGSEIKSFLEHPDFVKEINKDALKPYLTFQYSALDETFFKGVFKLRPGHCFTWDEPTGEMVIEAYNEFGFDPASGRSFKDVANETAKALDESVKYHAGADVGVGAFMSGGIETSYIAKDLKPAKTFSVGYEDGDLAGLRHAKEFSEYIGAENISKVITAEEFFAVMDKVQYHCDEPFSDPTAVSLYYLAEIARDHVTVVLSGEGGDELFAGYDIYSKDEEFKDRPIEDWYIGHGFIFGEEEAKEIVATPYKKGPTIKEITKPFFDKIQGYDDISKKQYLDLHLWLPNEVLLKADKMANVHCLEGRTPFLDREVMKVASKFPVEYKMNESGEGNALYGVASRILHDDMQHMPKSSIIVPFGKWMRTEKWFNLVKETFEADYAKEFFDVEAIMKLLKDHYEEKAYNASRIYGIYAFLVWYRVYFK